MASSKKAAGSEPGERLGGPRELSARQAAARLGVKVETIYAYVSRGLLERLPGPDGRSSVFEAKAVERLARKRGSVVAIGHPYTATLELLERELPKLADEGFELVTISELVLGEVALKQ
jgi:hypothetical protein